MELLMKTLETGCPMFLREDKEPPILSKWLPRLNTKLSDIGCFIANEVVIRYRLGRSPMETMSRF
jgi:hypothetical protein